MRTKRSRFTAVAVTDNTPLPEIDLLLMTAVPVERDALLRRVKPFDGDEAPRQYPLGQRTFYAGLVGKYRCALVTCRKGTSGRDGSTLTGAKAIELWNPPAVIMVGIAFGASAKKQKIGDVLVCDKIAPYEKTREGETRKGEDEVIDRGERPEAGQVLLNRAEHLDWDWKPTRKSKPRRAQVGLLLSGEKLVDNARFKKRLLARFPEAIGGEMEGHGLYSSAADANCEWIVIKAICDWGENKNSRGKRKKQELAARNAVSFLAALLEEPGLESHQFPPRAQARRAAIVVATSSADAAAKALELTLATKEARDAYKDAAAAMFEWNKFAGALPLIDGRRVPPPDQRDHAKALKLGAQTADEHWLNVNNDICTKFLAGRFDSKTFLDSFAVEICEIVERRDAFHAARLHPREGSKYLSIWQTYDVVLQRYAPQVSAEAVFSKDRHVVLVAADIHNPHEVDLTLTDVELASSAPLRRSDPRPNITVPSYRWASSPLVIEAKQASKPLWSFDIDDAGYASINASGQAEATLLLRFLPPARHTSKLLIRPMSASHANPADHVDLVRALS